MINRTSIYIGFSLIVFTIACFAGASSWAADCEALYKEIRKERVLMKKKALIEAAQKDCPNDPDIAYQEGYILERLRRYDEALGSYQRILAIDPGYAKAYFSIGDIKVLFNNYDEAAEAYREGLRYDPDNSRARNSLQEVVTKVGEKKALPANKIAASSEKKVEPVESVSVEKAAVPNIIRKVARSRQPHAIKPITRLSIPFEGRELSQDSRDVLSVVVGQAMKRDDMRKISLEIAGYTDAGGSSKKNIEVSGRRAAVVKSYLAGTFGIDEERLRTVAYGGKNPKAPNDSPENRRLNNRVEFTKID